MKAPVNTCVLNFLNFNLSVLFRSWPAPTTVMHVNRVIVKVVFYFFYCSNPSHSLHVCCYFLGFPYLKCPLCPFCSLPRCVSDSEILDTDACYCELFSVVIFLKKKHAIFILKMYDEKLKSRPFEIQSC